MILIISHTYKYIFLKSKKTAGSSIEIALSRSCGPSDVVTPLPPKDEEIRTRVGGRGAQNYTSPPLPVAVHQHGRAVLCRDALGQTTFDSYYRFVVQRNPWDAVVSLFYWVNRNKKRYTFDEFLHGREVSNLVWQNYGTWHIEGKLAVDRVVRYESLQDDLGEVWAHLGLPGGPDLPMAKSGFRPPGGYRDMYDAAGRERIARLFAPTIRELGYDF